MKTEIKSSGTIVISAETELEAYALRRWQEDNKNTPKNIIIKYSLAINCEDLEYLEIQRMLKDS